MRGVTPALSACRRPLRRRLVESGKPTASPRRSPENSIETHGDLFDLGRATGWLPFLDTYRTMCFAPDPAFRRVLEEIRELRLAVKISGVGWGPSGGTDRFRPCGA